MKRYSQRKTCWLDVPPVVASTVAMGTTGPCHMTKDQPMGWWHWTHTQSSRPCTLFRDVIKQTANSAATESRRKETFTLSSRSIHSNLSLSRSSWTRYAFESKAEEDRLPHQQHTPHTWRPHRYIHDNVKDFYNIWSVKEERIWFTVNFMRVLWPIQASGHSRRDARLYLHVELVAPLSDLLFSGQSVVQVLHSLLQLIQGGNTHQAFLMVDLLSIAEIQIDRTCRSRSTYESFPADTGVSLLMSCGHTRLHVKQANSSL